MELSQAWPCMSLQMSPRSVIERKPEMKRDLRFSSKGVMVLHALHGWRSTVNTLREQKNGRMAGQLAEGQLTVSPGALQQLLKPLRRGLHDRQCIAHAGLVQPVRSGHGHGCVGQAEEVVHIF